MTINLTSRSGVRYQNGDAIEPSDGGRAPGISQEKFSDNPWTAQAETVPLQFIHGRTA